MSSSTYATVLTLALELANITTPTQGGGYMASPGWYADAQDATLARWYDGTTWTADTMPMAQASAPPTSATLVAKPARSEAGDSWFGVAVACLALAPTLAWLFSDSQPELAVLSAVVFVLAAIVLAIIGAIKR